MFPNQQAINAILEHVRIDPEDSVPPPPSHTHTHTHHHHIGKLLEMILNMNHFEFNMKLYIQISGTDLGTSCVLSLANIFMWIFEKVLLQKYHIQPLLWLWFIDSIFLFWTLDQLFQEHQLCTWYY